MSNEDLGFAMLGSAGLGAIMGAAGVITLIWYVFQVIANWKVFTKAGEKGWKSLIPFYNLYTQYKLTWTAKAFWISLAVMVVSGVCSGLQSSVAGILSSVASIALLVLTAMGYNKLAKSFGYGTGFTVGLLLFYPIFSLILAFGKSQYIGNTCEAPASGKQGV